MKLHLPLPELNGTVYTFGKGVAMPDGSQTEVRKGRKFDQVIEGATGVFMTDGFERASVDEIARRAGVSKATLYSYFPDKRLLFVEVMKRECQRQADEAKQLIDKSNPPTKVLPMAGRIMLEIFLSDFGLQTFRMSVSESQHFEGLGVHFYECGPQLVETELVEYFKVAEARGELLIEDKKLAAHQFVDLCRSWLVPRRLMQVQVQTTDTEKARVIDGAVEMFLARYGTA